MFVSTVRPQNNNILIVSDKFYDKIVCDIFRHFKYLSQVWPQPYLELKQQIKTFKHSCTSLENHTRFQTKMGKL